ncbi:MAG: XdhC/CoxI family protein [Pseudomonadota bacterium]|nr:XdhC/CoxI family protein [Pseudomonadota bacterium]
MKHSEDTIPIVALDLLRQGQRICIATVIETWGSAPRPPGSQLLLTSEGIMDGSISGGCVESAVLHYGLDAIRIGKCQLHEFGVSDETAFSVGLSCGGKIKVLIEPVNFGQGIPKKILEKLSELISRNEKFFLVTDLNSFERSIHTFASSREVENFSKNMEKSSALSTEKSFVIGSRFFNYFGPMPRLVIIGAVHIAQALVKIAELAAFEIIVIDPRDIFSSPVRFPSSKVIVEWPDKAIPQLAPNTSTAIVFLTHDPKIDDSGLKIALRSDAFYVGCLGSRKTHKKRRDRLLKMGFSDGDINRIHAPVGLDIGAITPEEIAVSIMSEVILKLRKIELR